MRSLIDIYLNDHAAGAAAGRRLARRVARNNSDTSWSLDLHRLADEIDEDARALDRVREGLSVRGGRWARSLAVAGELVSRMKPNGRLFGYSPLSRVLETETLISGVHAKRRLWAALREGLGQQAHVEGVDHLALESRADAQIELLRRFHGFAVIAAFEERRTSLGSDRTGARAAETTWPRSPRRPRRSGIGTLAALRSLRPR